jgi:hypothetical protein
MITRICVDHMEGLIDEDYCDMSFMTNLRHRIRGLTGRDVVRIDKKSFVKLYSDIAEAYYEYGVLLKILSCNPRLFKVPKVFRLTMLPNKRVAIVMEYVHGRPLDIAILAFLFSHNFDVLGIFNRIGKALRELHQLPLTGLKSSELPSSNKIFIKELKMLVDNGMKLRLFNVEEHRSIIHAIESLEIVEGFFTTTNLHGEMYFTHILLQRDGSIAFVDFHNMQKGPLYYDLAMLAISLYSSILFMPWSPKRLTPLIKAFLTGYFEKCLNNRYIKSFAAVQLYVILRELQKYLEMSSSRESIIKVVIPSKMKTKRLRRALKEVVIPQLAQQ